MRVAVVGAGVSGLATARALVAAGIDVVVYEERSDVGGVWSATRRYPGVRTQNDKRTYSFSDLPMGAGYDEYPTGAQVQAYLAGYARHHALDGVIRLNTRVEQAAPRPDGAGWEIRLAGPEGARTEHADWLVMANGICSLPYVPAFDGQDAFTAAGGRVHTPSDLGDGEVLRDRHVVVVGYGKSAADIAVAALGSARSVTVVARGLGWKLPLRMGRLTFQRIAMTRLGEHVLWAPTRTMAGRILRRLDAPLRRRLVARLEQRVRDHLDLERRGLLPGGSLPEFTHLVTPGFFEAIDAGRIRVAKGARIERLEAVDGVRRAVLSDGTVLEADVVVAATGYDQDLGILGPAARDALVGADGDMRLYLHTLPRDVPRLAFVGWSNSFRSPIGAEMQALWLTALLLGQARRPAGDAWAEGARAYRLTHAAAAAKREPQFSHGASITDFDRWIAEAGLRMPRAVRRRELLRPLDPAAYAPLLRQLLAKADGAPRRPSAPDEAAEPAGARE